MASYSRLSRIEERRSKRQLLWVILGIGIVILLLITLGIPLVAGVSALLGNLNSQPLQVSDDKTPPLPPQFSTQNTATNSATYKIEGYGEPETTITLIVNGEEEKKLLLPADGAYSFPDVNLVGGENLIYGKLTDAAGNTSSDSDILTITYKKTGPKLEITDPQEGQTFAKNQQEISIKGTTDPNTSVTINDRFVKVNDDGTFEYKLKLADGENTLVILARDSAENITKVEKKVTYQP
ncbi:MAG: hypothetical protein AAB874_01955 [Patescibacteria group bacterium]